MTVRRFTAPALLGAFAASIVAVGLHPPPILDRMSSLFPLAMVLLVAGSIAYFVWITHPAVTLTAAVVLSPLAANWKLLGVPGGMSPDRLLLVGGISVVLCRGPGARDLDRLRLRATHAVLALVLVYATISAAIVGTLVQKDAFFRLFDAFGVLPFLAFLVAPSVFSTARARSILLSGLVGLGLYLGLTALFESLKLNSLVFPRFIVQQGASSDGRAFGVFLEPVSNGAGMFVCCVASVVAFATWRATAARTTAVLAAIVTAAGTFLTLERSVWLGTVAAALVTVAVSAPRLGRSAPRAAAALALLAATVAAVAAAYVFVPGLSQNTNNRANDQATVWDRQNLTVAATNMVSARPLFGFGWSKFETSSLEYFRQDQNYPLDPSLAFNAGNQGTFSVHNEFLDYAATLGLVGVSLWLLSLALAFGGAVRARASADLGRWRFALLPIVIFYLAIENAVPPSLFPNLALWLWMGVVWSGYVRPAPAREPVTFGSRTATS